MVSFQYEWHDQVVKEGLLGGSDQQGVKAYQNTHTIGKIGPSSHSSSKSGTRAFDVCMESLLKFD